MNINRKSIGWFALFLIVLSFFAVQAGASELVIRLKEYDAYGTLVNEPFPANQISDTQGLNTVNLTTKRFYRQISTNSWSQSNSPKTNWQNGYFTITGSYNYLYRDRFGTNWSATINTPAGKTLYVSQIAKHYNVLNLTSDANGTAYQGNEFTIRIGDPGLTTLQQMMDLDYTAYTRAYNRSGQQSYLCPVVGTNASIYVIHTKSGAFQEISYAAANLVSLTSLWERFYNITPLRDYGISLLESSPSSAPKTNNAGGSNTSKTIDTDKDAHKLPTSSPKFNFTIMPNKTGKTLAKIDMNKMVAIDAIPEEDAKLNE